MNGYIDELLDIAHTILGDDTQEARFIFLHIQEWHKMKETMALMHEEYRLGRAHINQLERDLDRLSRGQALWDEDRAIAESYENNT